jgi:hypothetical protein
MNTIGQWAHQHDLVLVCLEVALGTGLLLLLRRPRVRWWLAWFGMTATCFVGLASLRTPAASLSVHAGDATATLSYPTQADKRSMLQRGELDLGSVEGIEKVLADGETPILVEVY